MRRLPLLPFFLLAACSADATDGLDGGPGVCTAAAECSATEWCVDGKCVARGADECATDDGCEANETCEVVTGCTAVPCAGNTCVPKVCDGNDDCEEGQLCIDGGCELIITCEGNDDCDSGFICVGSMCVPENTGPCTSDDDCDGDGDICVSGQCGPPVPCDDATDCDQGLQCFDGECRDPCTQDADCNPPLSRCDLDTNECRPGCFNDGQCPEDTICEQFLCVDAQCTVDADCDTTNNETCEGADNGHGRCVMFTPCGPNNECPNGSICNETTNRCDPIPPCRTDRDCEGDAYCEAGFCIPSDGCTNMSCAAGFECVADICVPAPCRGDADCPVVGELCIGGVCEAPPSTDFVTEVRIVSPAGYVRSGTTYRFVAIALNQAGRAVPGVSFAWASSDVAVATIDGAGIATGGQTAGTTNITAAVQTSIGPVTSQPVVLTNLDTLAAGDVRIAVYGLAGGAAIANAEVELSRPAQTLRMVTDASGIVVFPGAAAGGDYSVTVAHANYDWISVMAPNSNDLGIALPPLTRLDRAAGLKGDVDLSRVSTQGAISLSLSGASMPSPLLGFDPGMLFGNGNFEVAIPMVGNIPVPAANTLAIEVMGFPLDVKDTYYAEAQPGLRAAWSFGGHVDFGGGGLGLGDLQNLLAAVLPFYQSFEHTVLPSVLLQSRPLVVDSIDIDGDGDDTEMLPDWNAFPTRTLTPDTAQNLRYQLAVSNLPFVSGGNANTLIVLSGTIVSGLGFVPLGLDGQSDSGGTGIVGSFVTKMAPRHSGLEAGDYAVMTIAIRVDQGGIAGPGSVRLYTTPRLPTAVNLADGWLDSPVNATWNPTGRSVTAGNILGADLYRTSFSSAEGGWHVYAAPPVDGTVEIPAAPMSLTDRAVGATVTFDVVDLATGATTGTLFDAANGGVVSIDTVTRGFARALISP